MASAVNALTSPSVTNSGSSNSAASLNGTAPSEETFLQLLVAQLQNQDPLNPTDSTAFVSELAQFSELEQVMAIRSDIESYAASGAAQGTSGASNPGQISNQQSSNPTQASGQTQ
jgi:flagellar basal-body rod modification protein FlgD